MASNFSCKNTYCALLLLVLMAMGCDNPDVDNKAVSTETLFSLLPSEQTHIDFNNALTEGLNTNVMMYEYFYNGGGVAIADINNDNLDDIYFTGNMTGNKLYLNKGNMQFEDITQSAGVEGRDGPWKTGVSMVDINGDGLTDIFLNYSGKINGKKRVKQLFINKGNGDDGLPFFLEEAATYGLADSSFTTQTVFFDYDNDNDLDALFINHNPNRIDNLDDNFVAQLRKHTHPTIGIKLLQNNKGDFTEVTKKAGFQSTALSYGLGAAVADVNEDGLPDLYLSNDYDVPDYLYINNGNGTFTDKLNESIGHTSHFSMGCDVADINNDGLPDIYSLDMLPEGNHRQKKLFAADNYNSFDLRIRSGFHYQYMRNMLQLNNGNGTFSEIGQLAGISNTDWSWAPLFADFDNDGWKDLLVTNGFVRDYTDLDFSKYAGDHLQKKSAVFRKDFLELVHKMPSSNVVNYLFKNNKDLTFSNVTASWGMDLPSNSNGAAYSDLDNDGDLDIAINNINRQAFIYRNDANHQLKHHFLKIKLKGNDFNAAGLGVKVSIYRKGNQQHLEQMPMRGFQSSVSPILHFGLGEDAIVDSLKVQWPNGKQQTITKIVADKVITLNIGEAIQGTQRLPVISPIFKTAKEPFIFRDHFNSTIDFKRQPLLINPLSFSGPCLVKGDINGDGLEDVYAGGGMGESAKLFMQQSKNEFQEKNVPGFNMDKYSEDTDAVFLDVNNDGFTDLYVCSGGYHEYAAKDNRLQDRLYLNDGKGSLTKDESALPAMKISSSCVRENDINNDGYVDLFIGGRVIPGRYPEAPRSYMLVNDGKGKFMDMTSSLGPSFENLGMVTDAAWVDLNNDNQKDLIVVGEWMPVTVFLNVDGEFVDKTSSYFDKSYSGWWNKILTGDFNRDGKTDLIIGNLGLNSQCKASDKQPAELFYKDLDNNGSVDPIFCFYIQGISYPYVSRDELLEQLGMMRKRFVTYKSYADATLKDIFTEGELKDINRLEANILTTAYFQSDGHGRFHLKELPVQAQYSPVYTLTSMDYDNDGNEDVLLCGNIAEARLRFGKYDANYGVLLRGGNDGEFTYVPQRQSGLKLTGDVRSAVRFDNRILFGINQQAIQVYEFNLLNANRDFQLTKNQK